MLLIIVISAIRKITQERIGRSRMGELQLREVRRGLIKTVVFERSKVPKQGLQPVLWVSSIPLISRMWSLECGQDFNSTEGMEPHYTHSWVSQNFWPPRPRFSPVHLSSLWCLVLVTEFRKGCGETGVGWEKHLCSKWRKTMLKGKSEWTFGHWMVWWELAIFFPVNIFSV